MRVDVWVVKPRPIEPHFKDALMERSSGAALGIPYIKDEPAVTPMIRLPLNLRRFYYRASINF